MIKKVICILWKKHTITDKLNLVDEVEKIAQNYENDKVLVLSTRENVQKLKEYKCIDIGSKNDLQEISHNIFSSLRKIDNYDVDLAIIEGVRAEGVGLAIMNRLIRACEHDYIKI